MGVRIDDLSEGGLVRYREFRCSRCCYFIHRDESSLKDPEAMHDFWEKWYRRILAVFGPCVKVASVDGERVVGMIWFLPVDLMVKEFEFEKMPYHLFRDIPVWELVPVHRHHDTLVIYCVFVPDKSYEGKGIGRMLVQSTIDQFRKPHSYLGGGSFSQIFVLAGRNRPGPAGPEQFFSRFGFQPVAVFGDQDSVVMKLAL